LLFNNRNASIITDLSAERFNVMGSYQDLVNVVVNILENSIKYSKDVPLINVSTYNDKNHVLIKISDKGMGMNNDVKERIFDKFYRETKGNIHNVKGHGLGLSYVKKIIDLHFGIINVDSTLRKGSTFLIKFPLNI
jgi:two-component system phosphate regulon sensor histidine kinase PhoR